MWEWATNVKRERWLPGELAWFEYHCWESPESNDAPAWYHSHQQVRIIALEVNDSDGMTRAERDDAGMPFTYTVQFSDSLQWCAFEDELTDSTDTWYRPDPPRMVLS
jgi:hypothetical protein